MQLISSRIIILLHLIGEERFIVRVLARIADAKQLFFRVVSELKSELQSDSMALKAYLWIQCGQRGRHEACETLLAEILHVFIGNCSQPILKSILELHFCHDSAHHTIFGWDGYITISNLIIWQQRNWYTLTLSSVCFLEVWRLCFCKLYNWPYTIDVPVNFDHFNAEKIYPTISNVMKKEAYRSILNWSCPMTWPYLLRSWPR